MFNNVAHLIKNEELQLNKHPPLIICHMEKVSGVLVPKRIKNIMGTLDDQNQLSHLPTSVTTTASNMESQDKEKPEETLGIVALIACYFIWSASQASIGGWGIRLPPDFEKVASASPLLHSYIAFIHSLFHG